MRGVYQKYDSLFIELGCGGRGKGGFGALAGWRRADIRVQQARDGNGTEASSIVISIRRVFTIGMRSPSSIPRFIPYPDLDYSPFFFFLCIFEFEQEWTGGTANGWIKDR